MSKTLQLMRVFGAVRHVDDVCKKLDLWTNLSNIGKKRVLLLSEQINLDVVVKNAYCNVPCDVRSEKLDRKSVV